MSLKIIAPCLYPSEAPAAYLKKSCRAHGLDLYLYGIGRQFIAHGADAQVVQLLPVLEAVGDPFVLVTDCRDVLMLTDQEEIMQKFDSFRSPLVMSTEKGCWPPNPEVIKGMPSTPLSYDHINAGQYIGERTYIIHCLKHLLKVYRPDHPMGLDNSQGWWPLALLRGELEFSLDSRCRLFQTMSGGETYQVKLGRIYIPVTGAFPCSIHFNGNGDSSYYNALGEQLYGKAD